nr:hypothetical protein [Tanacetum cinerariifolium]
MQCYVGYSFNFFQRLAGIQSCRVYRRVPTGSGLFFYWYFLVHTDELVSAGGCTLPAGSNSFLLWDTFLLSDSFLLRLEGLLQQRKRRLVLSDSEGDDATKDQEFDLAALHTLASVTLGDDPSATAAGPDVNSTMLVEGTSTTRRRLRKSSPGVRVPAAAATIPAASSVDAAIPATAAPSSSIPTDKGKAPMVDDLFPAALLSEQERVLKNLHDSQLGEELAKKIQAEQEAEFARQQDHTPVREPSPVRELTPMREPTLVRDPSPHPKQEPTPDSPSPPSLPPSSAEVGPTTSSRPPSPSRPPSSPVDIREGGGDFASSPPSIEAPQTPAAMAAGGAEDSATLTILTLKLDECLHTVSTLETELGVTKKVLGGAVLKLVTRVK